MRPSGAIMLALCVLLLRTVHDDRVRASDIAEQCSGSFVRHTLAHTTIVTGSPARLFKSNGAGLTISDLNNDGQLDLVFANIDGLETILWNQGHMRFQAQKINIPGETRAVQSLDLNADGWRDLIFTSPQASLSVWINQHDGTFTLTSLPGVSHPAYSMNWGDLDGDGDLDLVTGSYDAELAKRSANDFLFRGGGGVYYYENQGGRFVETQLAETSQALAILLTDLNGDAHWDIAVGNDFGLRDGYWTRQNGVWTEFHPFSSITYSTMSFDVGDLNNDGTQEFFAADMHPARDDTATRAAWQPVIAPLLAKLAPDDPQVMTNTLQMLNAGSYLNRAEAMGVAATGWSWSSRFGDLDNDGFLDLYIVNGMIAQDLFGHLPRYALVEPNEAFRNVGGQTFVPAPEWALGGLESGRSMSMADLDDDGDLDIVVNNLLAASVVYENQLCSGSSLSVSLQQLGTTNLDAIGARLILHTSSGSYQREVRAASGYLSGDPGTVYFGFPNESHIDNLEIFWPDGAYTRANDLDANSHLIMQHP